MEGNMPGNRTWWGLEHHCEEDGQMVPRDYPVLHWEGEGPKDPPSLKPNARTTLVCDACGSECFMVIGAHEPTTVGFGR